MTAASAPHPEGPGAPDLHALHHHGDQDLAPGLVDLAVNVRRTAPPAWLARVIASTIESLGSYPDPIQARDAIAARHQVEARCVLPTSGGAEAFTLLARALRPAHPVVVHPQFTEPEAALIAAGQQPQRYLLDPDRGFLLDPEGVDPRADLVVVGNPTNPTGVLHPATVLEQLRRRGRILVVDEAFMDAVPGEPETLIGPDLQGVLVLRSLTKTWGLAGLRAGYVVGDPTLVEALRAAQPPWSVSSPALAAMVACSAAAAVREAEREAHLIDEHRAVLVAALEREGFAAAAASRAPFVLIDTSALGAASTRADLAALGLAVRRGETFPGLGPTWIRVAVRTPDVTARLVAALSTIRRNRRAA